MRSRLQVFVLSVIKPLICLEAVMSVDSVTKEEKQNWPDHAYTGGQ